MDGHLQTASPPDRSVRWLVLPALGGALLAALAAAWRRRIQPAVTPVSDDWLRTYEARAGREWDL